MAASESIRDAMKNLLNIVEIVASLLLAAIWLVAGISKIFYYSFLAQMLQDFGFFSLEMQLLAALWLPWFEVFVGIAHLLPETRKQAFRVSAALMLAFGCWNAYVLFSGYKGKCGCFGQSDLPLTWLHVLANGILCVVSAYFSQLAIFKNLCVRFRSYSNSFSS